MIQILCESCDQVVMVLDPTKIGWPLHSAMFAPVNKNQPLPSGPIGVDMYCGVCFGFPLHWNAGTGVVGEYLKVVSSDGKPIHIKTADLIEKWKGVARIIPPNPVFQPEPKPVRQKAKPGPKFKKSRGKDPNSERIYKSKPPQNPMPPELKTLVAQVEGKQDTVAPLVATPNEIKAARLEQDREREALGRDKERRQPRPASR